MSAESDALDQKMLTAHATGDKARLVDLYRQAADLREAEGDVDATCFYLTHAYVFALDQGDASATVLHKRLKDFGREE
ncbi:MAG: hypothetical protein ACU0CA_05365 [Paracoccaceae bacterium]